MEKIIKKGLATAIIIVLVTVTIIGNVPISAQAESKTVYEKDGGYYNVYLMRTYYAKTQERKINTPGFRKTKYTYGSIAVTKSQSFGFSTSTDVKGEYKGIFCSVGTSFGVTTSVTETVSAGTTLYVDKDAPNGVYYAYLYVPHKKVYFNVRRCSSNYVSWSTKYEKTFDYAPMQNMDYIEVKAMQIY